MPNPDFLTMEEIKDFESRLNTARTEDLQFFSERLNDHINANIDEGRRPLFITLALYVDVERKLRAIDQFRCELAAINEVPSPYWMTGRLS